MLEVKVKSSVKILHVRKHPEPLLLLPIAFHYLHTSGVRQNNKRKILQTISRTKLKQENALRENDRTLL